MNRSSSQYDFKSTKKDSVKSLK